MDLNDLICYSNIKMRNNLGFVYSIKAQYVLQARKKLEDRNFDHNKFYATIEHHATNGILFAKVVIQILFYK